MTMLALKSRGCSMGEVEGERDVVGACRQTRTIHQDRLHAGDVSQCIKARYSSELQIKYNFKVIEIAPLPSHMSLLP